MRCIRKKRGDESLKDDFVNPELVIASAILLTCELYGKEISVEKVANVTGISELKLRKLYPEIRACMVKCSMKKLTGS